MSYAATGMVAGVSLLRHIAMWRFTLGAVVAGTSDGLAHERVTADASMARWLQRAASSYGYADDVSFASGKR